MPPKKMKSDVSVTPSTSTNKIWRANGSEQKELNHLFKKKIVDESTTPNKVRQSNPLFLGFSAKVFSEHFRKTKSKFGKANNVNVFSVFLNIIVLSANESKEEDFPEIPQLGFTPESKKALGFEADSDSDYTGDKDYSDIQYKDAPSMVWVYTDHERKCDIVNVAVPVIAGSQKVNFGLSEDGLKLFVTYVWPAPMYSPAVLFANKLANRTLTLSHPKIHSFATRLLECGFSEKSTPTGTIVIRLPMKVQRENDTWTKEGIKCDESNIVLLEFKAYQKKLFIEDADTSITFV